MREHSETGCFMPTIVPAYAAILALMFIALSLRVIGLRRSSKVALGAGSNAALERRIRVQANFAEYVPLALLLLAFAEFRGWPAWTLHALAAALVVGRLSHAYGVARTDEDSRFRVTGMAMTFTVLGLTAFGLLVSIIV
jgi:uncharacterized protein